MVKLFCHQKLGSIFSSICFTALFVCMLCTCAHPLSVCTNRSQVKTGLRCEFPLTHCMSGFLCSVCMCACMCTELLSSTVIRLPLFTFTVQANIRSIMGKFYAHGVLKEVRHAVRAGSTVEHSVTSRYHVLNLRSRHT